MKDPVVGELLFWVYWVYGPKVEKIVIDPIMVLVVDDPAYPVVENIVGIKIRQESSATNLFRDRDEAEREAASRLLSLE